MIIKFKVQSSKFKILGVIILLLVFLYPNPYTLTPTHAQACPTQNLYPRVQQGLISTPAVTQNFGSDTGECVVDSKAAFAPYKLPSYEDLKSLYYTQSKATKTDATPASGTANQGTLRSAFNNFDVVWINGDVDINGAVGGTSKTAVVFVERNLNINKNFTFGDDNNGVVFAVGNDVNIDKDVKQIDAVIIASGTIRTAGSSCTQNSIEVDTSTDALTVNGSLISLDVGRPIQFCRKLKGLGNDQDPAEIINNQVKYLVILKDLFADTIQRWSEIQ